MLPEQSDLAVTPPVQDEEEEATQNNDLESAVPAEGSTHTVGTDTVEVGGRKHRKKKRKAKKKEPEEEEVEGEISMEGETTSTHLSEGKCYVTAASTLKIEIAICTGHGASSSGHIRNLPALPDELQQPTVAGEEQEHAMGVGGREIFRHELSCPNGEHC